MTMSRYLGVFQGKVNTFIFPLSPIELIRAATLTAIQLISSGMQAYPVYSKLPDLIFHSKYKHSESGNRSAAERSVTNISRALSHCTLSDTRIMAT